jgi:IS5 family transposase
VEGTISQADRRTGLKQARYRGLAKVQLEQVTKATALNLIRLADHLAGTPRTRSRTRHLRRALAPAA